MFKRESLISWGSVLLLRRALFGATWTDWTDAEAIGFQTNRTEAGCSNESR